MASDYFLEALDRYRLARATDLGCQPEDFDGHSLGIGSDFYDRHIESNEFDNALGEYGQEYAASLWRFGFALFAGDVPVAVAGAYDDGEGLLEIGVDVARAHRGTGLAPVVVSNLARLIADEGRVPTYYCAPTNVRSHRNALACGFLPVASAARVTKPRA